MGYNFSCIFTFVIQIFDLYTEGEDASLQSNEMIDHGYAMVHHCFASPLQDETNQSKHSFSPCPCPAPLLAPFGGTGKKRAWVWEYKASICSATTCKYKFTICKNIRTYQKYQLKADRLVHSPDAGRFNAFASQKQSDCACKPPTQEEFTLATALRLLFINLQTIC